MMMDLFITVTSSYEEKHVKLTLQMAAAALKEATMNGVHELGVLELSPVTCRQTPVPPRCVATSLSTTRVSHKS